MTKILKTLLTGALLATLATAVCASNQLVTVDIWNASSDQPSMGNISTDNNEKALYNQGENTLELATNPVNVSGYQSGIVAMRYDATGQGDFVDVAQLSIDTVETGTKSDGFNHTVEYLSRFAMDIPAYLTRQGVEYISIQMRVPYTPMDVVVGTGYLDARLRIDWDDMEATDWVQLTPNTQLSTGSVSAVVLEDGGISILADTTILASEVVLHVSCVTSGTAYDLAKVALDGNTFELYAVDVTLNGNAVTPTGSLEIVFPYSALDSLYRINDDGSKTILRGTSGDRGYSILSRSLGLFAVVGGEKIAQPSFADIAGHWAEETITNAVSAGLFNGTSDTAFSPEAQMTNGMVITVLHRMAGSPSATATSSVWYAEAMAWGYENGIIGGYTDFDGEANVTREALATMLHRYDGATTVTGDLTAFTDSTSISDWAVDGLTWANSRGIVTGKSATTIAPQNLATRAEVATMLWRYIGS